MTIPLEIRRALGIEAVTEVDFLLTADAVQLVRRAEGGSAAIVTKIRTTLCKLGTEGVMSFDAR